MRVRSNVSYYSCVHNDEERKTRKTFVGNSLVLEKEALTAGRVQKAKGSSAMMWGRGSCGTNTGRKEVVEYNYVTVLPGKRETQRLGLGA